MWRSMEEVLRELKEEGIIENNSKIENSSESNGLPPGFRFHPTDEELITFYLASKVFNTTTNTNTITNNIIIDHNNPANSPHAQIVEVDLTRCEPWDLPERARMGEKEWYLFSLRDRKYPSGLRTNRATETGYWKATGKDRQVYASGVATSGGGTGGVLIGMKKTLVFYQGRAPRGAKTKWVMHEYRLDGHFSSFRLSSKEEWVICRIFQKNNNVEKKSSSIIHPPPPPPPPPLSPFLGSLPPLQELTTAAAAATTNSLAEISSQPPHYANHDPNSLLHSLLLNPLPNFSSISGSDTIFPALATTFPSLWTTAAAVSVTKQQQQQQHWLDRICPQINQIQNCQHHYHEYHDNQPQHQPLMLSFDHMLESHYPFANPYYRSNNTTDATADHNHDDNDEDDDDADAVAVRQHVERSPSFAVTALDSRMLTHATAVNHCPPESWSFHPIIPNP